MNGSPLDRDWTADVNSSPTGEPIPDGGLPAAAGIIPASPIMLSAFLEEHSDAAGFELTYQEEGGEQTRVLHEVALHAGSLERPSAAPAIQCTPLTPGAAQFTVRVDAIELLNVVCPPPELYTAGATTPAEEATGLRRLAEAQPDKAPIPRIIALLEQGQTATSGTREALKALRYAAAERPAACTPAIPRLQTLLTHEDSQGDVDALAVLRLLGDHDPGAIAPLADTLYPYLESSGILRREATRCLAAIAEEFPEDVVDAVPALATMVEDGADGEQYAVYVLSRITTTNPHEVKPIADTLGTVILDETTSDDTRLNATAALGRIVCEFPSVGVDLVDDLTALFAAENPKLRNNAIALIGDVALVHTDVVEPYTEQIGGLLTVEDTYTRINASGALSRVAEDFPDSVAPLTSTFIELLADESPAVRKNACWTLGHLSATDAKPTLEKRARVDDDADVRQRAVWALDQINESTPESP